MLICPTCGRQITTLQILQSAEKPSLAHCDSTHPLPAVRRRPRPRAECPSGLVPQTLQEEEEARSQPRALDRTVLVAGVLTALVLAAGLSPLSLDGWRQSGVGRGAGGLLLLSGGTTLLRGRRCSGRRTQLRTFFLQVSTAPSAPGLHSPATRRVKNEGTQRWQHLDEQDRAEPSRGRRLRSPIKVCQ